MYRYIHSIHASLVLTPFVWSLLVGGTLAAAAEPMADADGGKTVRLFTVGNSFSGNATRFLPGLAKAGGHTLVLRTASVGGASLELHWRKAEAHEKDPQDPAGLYASKKGLREELAVEPWDFVTIQQASIKSHDIETYQPYARRLRDYIKEHAPGAEVLVHQTWAYRVDDPRFSKPPKAGEPGTQAAMHAGLTRAYRTLARDLDLRIIPVGDAFHRADTDPTRGFRPDTTFEPNAAMPPALPDQTHSLHVGWRWVEKDGSPQLQMDGHHANAAGEYLGACVFYEVVFDEDVTANTFVPNGLDAEYAAFLRQTAHATVAATRVPVSQR